MPSGQLAQLYNVPPKVLMQAVRRNLARFPSDFMFALTPDQVTGLRSQFVTLDKEGRGAHSKYPPHAFTEQGVAMLSSVLRSPHAVAVNIKIMRAFVRLRALAVTHADLRQRLDALEAIYDGQFRVVFAALRQLMAPPDVPRRQIGFRGSEGG